MAQNYAYRRMLSTCRVLKVAVMSENLPVPVLVRRLWWGDPPMSEGAFVLPTGTVTLLLADVEGSTRGWEADPVAMAEAIAVLNRVVDEQVGRHDGVRPVEQGEGDSFVAAFARARDAVVCALAIQHALAGERLRLRIGMHTGEVQHRDEGNYIGQSINRAARVRNVAHGGQTVLSETTRDLVIDALPVHVSLRDLGVHRLKDLSRPERIFQLCHPELTADFPPLRSLDAHLHNLPNQRTSLVGRTAEVAEVQRLLATSPLVTVTGAGGCGKTRLAIQVGAELVEAHPDGVWFADLSSVTDPGAVAAQVSQVFALKEAPGTSTIEALVAYLAERHAMLILDNCEHVLDAAARLADTLLGRCGRLAVLATSRQPLAVEGEVVWRLPSLPVPTVDGPAGIAGLSACDAVQLFVDRACLARPGFMLSEGNGAAVAEICRRLDGIPLAIELAAARVRVLGAAQIAEGLSERFALLSGAPRTAMPRQQTLEASIDWSHELLTAVEQVVFRRLAVLAGSFSFEAARDVAAGAGVEGHHVLDLLSLLVDKSLVLVVDDDSAARYHLLETVRAYAATRLAASGEEVAVFIRHRDHYLAFAEDAGTHLEGPAQDEWSDRVNRDYANLRAALAFSRERGDGEPLVRIASALAPFWSVRGPMREGEAWLDEAVNHVEVEAGIRLGALAARCLLARINWDPTPIITHADEGLRLAAELSDDRVRGRLLLSQGTVAMLFGQPSTTLDEAATVSRRVGDGWALAQTLLALGGTYLTQDPSRARPYLDECLALAEKTGNRAAATLALGSLGAVLNFQGDLNEAKAVLERALEAAGESVDAVALCGNLAYLAAGLVDADDRAAALDSRRATVSSAREAGFALFDPWVLSLRGRVALADGDPAGALRLGRAALGCSYIPVTTGWVLIGIGEAEVALGSTVDARAHVEELLVTSEALRPYYAAGLVLRARLARLDGDHMAAEAVAHQAINVAESVGAKSQTIDALELLAGIGADLGSYDEAIRLLAAAAAARERIGYRRCVTERDRDIAVVRESLDSDRFERSDAEGAALSLADVVAYARRGRGERKRPTTGWAALSPTETQVVALVTQGLSNPEIAEKLFISPRTVQAHLTHIFAKVGVTGRTELAAAAVSRGR